MGVRFIAIKEAACRTASATNWPSTLVRAGRIITIAMVMGTIPTMGIAIMGMDIIAMGIMGMGIMDMGITGVVAFILTVITTEAWRWRVWTGYHDYNEDMDIYELAVISMTDLMPRHFDATSPCIAKLHTIYRCKMQEARSKIQQRLIGRGRLPSTLSAQCHVDAVCTSVQES